jgi:hypothetical protein
VIRIRGRERCVYSLDRRRHAEHCEKMKLSVGLCLGVVIRYIGLGIKLKHVTEGGQNVYFLHFKLLLLFEFYLTICLI